MASVGELLKKARERQGLSIGQIADQTRIKAQYLQALEEDDFESLPGKFFARSFTAQYAGFLNCNTPELQAVLQNQLTPVDALSSWTQHGETTQLRADKRLSIDPLPEGTASAMNAGKMTASLIMLVAVIIACGTVFWLWQRNQVTTIAAGKEPTPKPAESKPIAGTVAPPVAQPTMTHVKPPEQPQSSAPITTPVQANSNPAPTPAPPPENYTAGRINLTVIGKEDTWIRITTDGKIAVQRVLGRGESSIAFAQDNAKVLLGNAGGVEIRFNGNDIGSVGPRGMVRTVEFTRDRFTFVEQPNKRTDAQPALLPVAESH